MLIASTPQRGDQIVDKEGKPLESFSEFLADLSESNNQDNPKNNFRATGAPAISNNASEGFTTGSTWIDAPTVYTLTSFTGADANWTALN